VSDARIVGILFIAAAVASVMGASMPSLARESVWMRPPLEYFRIIRAHERQWRAHAWLFAAGALLMGLALALELTLVTPSGAHYAIAGAVLYLLVAPLWLADLAFRLDFTVWASREPEPPPIFATVGRWAGSLYNVFMVGAFFAIALVGAAFIDSPLVPAWAGWVLIVFGVAAGLSHLAARPGLMGMRSPFDLPVLVQLLPLFVGIPLAAGG
jgi:hypothetical protein